MAKYTITMTPVDNFGGRSKVRFGVGEHIQLKAVETPAATPPTAMIWAVKTGLATVTNGTKSGEALCKCGNQGGAVVLELRKKADKSVLATKRLEVVPPDDVHFEKDSEYHKKNWASAGFEATPYLLPKDVSFKWVDYREGEAPYEGTGCFKQTEVSPDDISEEFAVVHPVMGEWIEGVKGGAKGTEMDGSDTVRTSIKNWGAGGTFTWNIPWYYRVRGVSGDYRFCTGVHKCVIAANGKTTITKFDVKVTKDP